MIKKTTSLTLTFSGIMVVLTSLVLYISPPSHVGHFSPWRFLALSRHYWGALHLNSGILFCLALFLHVYFNWKLLISYLKRKKQAPLFTAKPVYISLFLTLFVCVGACYDITPMKQVMAYARRLKMVSVRQYGSPPYGWSRSYPVSTIAGYMGWDPARALSRLKANHIIVASPAQPLKDVAQNNRTTIGCLLDIMCPDPKEQ